MTPSSARSKRGKFCAARIVVHRSTHAACAAFHGELQQEDGRIRQWAAIQKADGKYLRVVLLADQETVHNAFFDRRFTL